MPKAEGTLVPQEIVACALDTNCMPEGRLDVERLERLSEALLQQEFDTTEIWIPEPVLWEWAEHAHDELQRARGPYFRALRLAAKAGVEVTDDANRKLANVLAVVDQVDAALNGMVNVRILRLKDNPSAASMGLRDQVLQMGAGRRKTSGEGKRVKAGAADSASFRLIGDEAGADLNQVVLVSADRDVRRHFSDDSLSTPVVLSSIGAVTRAVLDLQPGSEAERELIRQLIFNDLPGNSEALVGAVLDGGADYFANLSEGYEYLESTVSPFAIEAVTEIGDIDASKSEGIGAADVYIVVSLKVEAAWWNAIDDRLEHEVDVEYGVPALAQVFAEKRSGNWRLSVDHLRAE